MIRKRDKSERCSRNLDSTRHTHAVGVQTHVPYMLQVKLSIYFLNKLPIEIKLKQTRRA